MFPLIFAGKESEKNIITTGSLFEEMIDMKNLAYFPDPAYRTIQYSSYDRRSTIPGGPEWFANSDGFGGEPVPNFEKVLKEPDADGIGEYLITDVEGPGAIVRLWTAAIAGKIRMYIDDSDMPIYEGEAVDFFHKVYDHFSEMGNVEREHFNRSVYQRDACYAPIPFAKRLRVIWTGSLKEIHFYQLQVRLYEKTASVVSFSPQDIVKYSSLIDWVTLALSDPDQHLEVNSQEPARLFKMILGPSEEKEALSITGPKALEKLTLQIKAGDIDKALRQTVLHILCDEYPWGQVQAPVGDFFGAAPGVNPYQ